MAAVTFTAAGDTTATGSSTSTGEATFSAQPMLSAQGVSITDEQAVVASAEEVVTMAAGLWDLHIEQGATFSQTYTADLDDGTPYSWDDWTAHAQIRSAPADIGALLLDLAPHLTVAGASVHLSIPAAVTQTLTRNGVWDLEMTQGPTVVRLLQGRVVVSPEVTRP